MVQSGDMLYIRTAHQMYQSRQDGLSHQANLTFSIQIPSMEITDQHSAVTNYGFGYVSRSTNQFLALHGKPWWRRIRGTLTPGPSSCFNVPDRLGRAPFPATPRLWKCFPISGSTGGSRDRREHRRVGSNHGGLLGGGLCCGTGGEGGAYRRPGHLCDQYAMGCVYPGSYGNPLDDRRDVGDAGFQPQLVRLADDRLLLMDGAGTAAILFLGCDGQNAGPDVSCRCTVVRL